MSHSVSQYVYIHVKIIILNLKTTDNQEYQQITKSKKCPPSATKESQAQSARLFCLQAEESLLSAGLETKIADAMRQHGWLFFVMPPNYGSRATRVILKRGPEIIKDFMSGANKGLFLCRSSPLRIMSEASNPHTTGG